MQRVSTIFSDYTMEPKKGPYPLLSQRITGIWLNRRDYITAELQANQRRQTDQRLTRRSRGAARQRQQRPIGRDRNGRTLLSDAYLDMEK